jgi:hypothetical protein
MPRGKTKADKALVSAQKSAKNARKRVTVLKKEHADAMTKLRAKMREAAKGADAKALAVTAAGSAAGGGGAAVVRNMAAKKVAASGKTADQIKASGTFGEKLALAMSDQRYAGAGLALAAGGLSIAVAKGKGRSKNKAALVQGLQGFAGGAAAIAAHAMVEKAYADADANNPAPPPRAVQGYRDQVRRALANDPRYRNARPVSPARRRLAMQPMGGRQDTGR